MAPRKQAEALLQFEESMLADDASAYERELEAVSAFTSAQPWR